MWLVQVRSPSDRRCFCAFSDDEATAVKLVNDNGYFDDSIIVEPLARMADDVAQGFVEIYWLVLGGVLPWPTKGN